jgi:hypothetical protein
MPFLNLCKEFVPALCKLGIRVIAGEKLQYLSTEEDGKACVHINTLTPTEKLGSFRNRRLWRPIQSGDQGRFRGYKAAADI